MEQLLDRAERVTPQPRSNPSVGTHADAGDAGTASTESDVSLAVPSVSPMSPVSPGVVRDPQTAATCELRVLTTIADLVESYRLRYDAYSALGYLQHFNQSKLEIDPYDLSSIPFGAFDATSGAMIGTLRLITKELQHDYERLISCILTEFPDRELAEQALGPRPHVLPAIQSDEIEQQIAAFNTGNFAVHEMSRFIVHPSHRFWSVSRGLGLLGIAHAMALGPAVFVAGCLPRHVRLYASYGFVKLPHSGVDHFDSVGQLANTIICRSDALPAAIQPHIDELLCSMDSGATEHTRELSRDSRALFRFAAPRRVRRRTMEW